METVTPLLPFVFIAVVAYLAADTSLTFRIGLLMLATIIYGLVEFATSDEDLTILNNAGGFGGKIIIFLFVGGLVLWLTKAAGKAE